MKDNEKSKSQSVKNDKTSTRERIMALDDIFDRIQYQNVGISMDEIQSILRNTYELNPNRKTLYKDIDVISEIADYRVEYRNDLKKYVIRNKWKLRIEDIEVITNALISSKFLSEKDTRELINKLHKNLGYKKKSILGIDHRVKPENEEFYEVINSIDKAIKENVKIRFDYYKLDTNMKSVCSIRDCIVSPLAHVWYEDLYYLLGNYEGNKISHYRIDRIKNIEIISEKRKPINEIVGKHEDFNVSEYVSKLAGMSSGEEITIKVLVDDEIIGKIYDKFGNKIRLIESDEESSTLKLSVINNKDLLSWILMLGDGIEVIHPKSIREELITMIEKMNTIYDIYPEEVSG